MTAVDGYRYWYYAERLGVCVCVPAKCGSTMAARYIFGCESVGALQQVARHSEYGPYSPAEVDARYPKARKLLAIRDPVERFASLWRNKCRDDPTLYAIPGLHGLSPTGLLTHIRGFPFGDVHWLPQYHYLVPRAELVRFDRLLGELGIPHERPINVTEHSEHDPALPVVGVQAHYHKDLELWRKIIPF